MAERKCRVTIDGEVREYAAGTTYQAIAAEFQHRYPHRIVLVFVDQFHLQELRKTVDKDCELKFVTTADPVGYQTYRRSMCFLLVKAVHDAAGHDRVKRVRIHFSVGKGFYCIVCALRDGGNSKAPRKRRRCAFGESG